MALKVAPFSASVVFSLTCFSENFLKYFLVKLIFEVAILTFLQTFRGFVLPYQTLLRVICDLHRPTE